MKSRAVFIDRDGTINEEAGYPADFGRVRIYPESFEGVRLINEAGLLAIVVTNQSGIGRGLLTESQLIDIHDKMRAAFTAQGARLDAFYYCPHYDLSPDPRYGIACECRKPNPGLARRAAADFAIDLQSSYMIGDKPDDVIFGLNIGATPILISTGFGRESEKRLGEQGLAPAFVAPDFLTAVRWIVEREKSRS
jgi:D-glycero-D-manno-heptose 1,7-bisphosphate phosphatase